MQRNQKFSRIQKDRFIEQWQTSGLTQDEYCKREKLAKSTFSYWLKKRRKQKYHSNALLKKPVKKFIPVEISGTADVPVLSDGQIQITYPNGLKVICPSGINIQQLKTLINM
jgi:hypothetical protein